MAANKSVLSAATTSHELTFISHELTTYFTRTHNLLLTHSHLFHTNSQLLHTHSLTHPPTHPPTRTLFLKTLFLFIFVIYRRGFCYIKKRVLLYKELLKPQ